MLATNVKAATSIPSSKDLVYCLSHVWHLNMLIASIRKIPKYLTVLDNEDEKFSSRLFLLKKPVQKNILIKEGQVAF